MSDQQRAIGLEDLQKCFRMPEKDVAKSLGERAWMWPSLRALSSSVMPSARTLLRRWGLALSARTAWQASASHRSRRSAAIMESFVGPTARCHCKRAYLRACPSARHVYRFAPPSSQHILRSSADRRVLETFDHQMKSLDRKMLTIKELKETRAIQIMDLHMDCPSSQSEASTPITGSSSVSPVPQHCVAGLREEARSDADQPGKDKDSDNDVKNSLSLSHVMLEQIHAGEDLCLSQKFTEGSGAHMSALSASPACAASQDSARHSVQHMGAPRHIIEAIPATLRPRPHLKAAPTSKVARNEPAKLALEAIDAAGMTSTSPSHQSDEELIAMLAGCATRHASSAPSEPAPAVQIRARIFAQLCLCVH